MAKKKIVSSEEELFSQIAEATGGETLDQLDSIKYFIDTGSLAFNYICSGRFIGGGIPACRITEFYGPEASGKSLIASNILFGTQKQNGIPIILDCENATNAEFMERTSHLNLKKIIRQVPESLEKAFLKIHTAVRKIREEVKVSKDVPIVFVYDSITVSPCERELRETQLPEDYKPADWKRIVGRQEQPGERAKIYSAELRKLNAILEKQNVTVVILNQTRDRIGVLYGCFHYNSRVCLADGTTMKIGKIVNQDMTGLEVMSFNPKTRKIEPKKIVKCFNNGSLAEGEEFLQFSVRRRCCNGKTQFACTPNHLIFNDSCEEVRAGSLEIGDKILVGETRYLTEDQKQVVYGSILGDGSVRSLRKKNDSAAHLRVYHGCEQEDYCKWKEEIMSPWIGWSGHSKKYDRYAFETIPMPELIPLSNYRDDYNVPDQILDNLDILGLAIWYMDDGTYRKADDYGNGQALLCCSKFNNRECLVEMLEVKFGLICKLLPIGLKFNSENTRKLHELIARYIPECMNYKLHSRFRDKFNYEIEEVDESSITYEPVAAEILDIYIKPPTCSKRKFDLQIEGNSTYLVDGAIVHNSPETTPGGNALKFYASLRVRTQQKKKIEDQFGSFAGVNMQAKNIKNRAFKPFVVANEIKVYFQAGVDPLSGLLDLMVQSGRVIEKTGGNYLVAPGYTETERKFKATKAENRVPKEVLLDCPKLLDVPTREDVESYLEAFAAAINATEGGQFGEKSLPDGLDELSDDE